MFYLSKDVLKEIINRFYASKKVFALPWYSGRDEAKLNLFHLEIFISVQVSDIHFFSEENVLAMELYDGSNLDANYSVTLDEKMWYLVDRVFMPLHFMEENNSGSVLKVGSILLLKEYSFREIFYKCHENGSFVDYVLYDILNIKDFVIIGNDDTYVSTVRSHFYN